MIAQTGHTLNGVGARGFGMAGIGTSYASSPSNALIWNPSLITHLPTAVELSTSIISLNTKNYASLDISLLNPALPTGSVVAGNLHDQADDTILPTFSLVFNPDNNWAFGLSAAGIGGFGADFRTSNESPLSLLFGDIKSEYRLFQVSIVGAYQVNDNLSLAIAPTFNLASLEFAPITTSAPTIVNGLLVYPSGDRANSNGYGVHIGISYRPQESWTIGLTYKSRQVFRSFNYDQINGLGLQASTDLDYPMILAGGVAYAGFSKLIIAFDFRVIDFSSTDGLGQSGYGSDLSVNGFGWQDAYFYGIGFEYALNDSVVLRSGYSLNTNPVVGELSFFSIPAPAVVQHAIGLGVTYKASNKIDLSAGFHHGFEESVSGPIVVPSAVIPSVVESSLSTKVASLDITFKL